MVLCLVEVKLIVSLFMYNIFIGIKDIIPNSAQGNPFYLDSLHFYPSNTISKALGPKQLVKGWVSGFLGAKVSDTSQSRC